MFTDKEKKERKELRHEIRARRLVIKKVENAYSRLSQQAENQLNKRKQKVAEFQGYRSVEEARDAYGWDIITEEEFRSIEEMFEKGEKSILNDRSAEEYAAQILGEFITRLKHDISSIEFELLPEKEQDRIRDMHYELAMKRQARKLEGENEE